MAAKRWVVLSDRLYTLHPKGKGDPRLQQKHFRGDVLTGLSDEDVERWTKAGAIAPHNSDEAKAAEANPAVIHPAEVSAPDALQVPTHQTVPSASEIVAAQSVAQQEPTEYTINSISDGAEITTRPPKSAVKEEWVDYAVASGQKTRDEALATSRDELRETLK